MLGVCCGTCLGDCRPVWREQSSVLPANASGHRCWSGRLCPVLRRKMAAQVLERATVSSPKTEDGGTGVGAGDCVQS